MKSSASFNLDDWVDRQTQQIDLIASWEVLISVYSEMGFTDRMDDTTRIAEFKSVIQEMNKFMTRTRKGLGSVRDIEDAIDYLKTLIDTQGSVASRQSLVYQKLRQRWVLAAVRELVDALEKEEETEREKELEERQEDEWLPY